VLTKLRAKHAEPGGAGATFGIDGNTGARARRACLRAVPGAPPGATQLLCCLADTRRCAAGMQR